MDINEQIAAGVAVHLKMAGLKFGTGAVALLLVVVVDVAPLIALSYGMIAFNVATGVKLSRNKFKNRPNPQPSDKWFDKEKWFKTSMKLLWFPILLVASRYMEEMLDVGIPVTKLVAIFICYHDFWSGADNVSELTGTDIWKAIGHNFKSIFTREKGPTL